ncbi:FAD binding domain-containing protein [Actinomycetospora flava]|uniref:FAD binding domain-containing protein n=1 Tax=Actinomycetospora flava TaxID=3129232 RepID=A0ABU8MA34_9PSEU
MIRTRLRYHRPDRPDDAAALLAEHHGRVAVLAGGSQLLPRMNRGETDVDHVVDLRGLGLRGIERTGGRVRLGAMVTYEDAIASPLLADAVPLLPRVARGVTGGRQLTGHATLVGALCHAFPGTDMPGALSALGATVELHGPSGPRSVPVSEFLLGAQEIDRRAGEFVAAVTVDGVARSGYCKVKHATGSWPIATASAVDDGDALTVTLGAVQARPLRIVIPDPTRAAVDDAVAAAVTAPWTDVLAPGDYRARIAPVVARRALTELREGARA